MLVGAVSPFLALGLAVLIAAVVLIPLRRFGRWLERAGRRVSAAEREPPEEKPYDPFAT